MEEESARAVSLLRETIDSTMAADDGGHQRAVASVPEREHELTSVVAIDSLEVVREGVSRMLSWRSVKVIATFSSTEDALNGGGSMAPDVVLLESPSNCASLHQTLKVLSLLWPHARVLLYYAHMTWTALSQATNAGVCGYVPKYSSAEELADAVLTLAAGGKFVHESILAPVLHIASGRASTDQLTPREQNVLDLLCRGLTNQEIAKALCLTVGTTKVYVSRILSKLGAADRTQAVVHALRECLVPALQGGCKR